jgi:ubiquinone/menaquinone biosynthesis C-methylase UbiE
MLPDELRAAREYDRWMVARDPHAALMRFLMSVPGMILVNTAAFRLPEELRIRRQHRVLDLGCGRGSLLRLLASRVSFKVMPVGLDASRQMLTLARKTIRDTGEAPVHLALGLASEVPFATGTFDLVICAHLFKYLSDAELCRSLHEIRRVLKPGGLCIAWEFAPTGSRLLDRFNRRVLSRGSIPLRLRTYRQLQRLAWECEFDWVDNVCLRPFLLPPIPRVSILLGKAPEGWYERLAKAGIRVKAPQAPCEQRADD